MKSIYLILSRSKSIVSTIVGIFTKDRYTHTSLSFDDHFDCNYSFGRRYARFPLPAGLITEGFSRGMYELYPDIPCAIYQLDCSDESWNRAREIIGEMMKEQKRYRYSLIGLINIDLGIARKYPYKYFCSQFVSEVLRDAGIIQLEKDPSLMKPRDIMEIEGLKLIYEGTIGCAHKEFNENR